MKIDFNTTASFDVDAQNTFTPLCPTELPVELGDTIVNELNLQAKIVRLRIGSKDAHSPNAMWVTDTYHKQFDKIANEPDMDIYWNLHAVPGTFGFQLLNGLPHPRDYDYFVWKGMEPDQHPYGACFHDLNNKLSTGVIEYLNQNNITTVIVGGLATDYCVKTTAIQLINAGFGVIVNLAACRGVSNTTTQEAVLEMEQSGIKIINNLGDLE